MGLFDAILGKDTEDKEDQKKTLKKAEALKRAKKKKLEAEKEKDKPKEKPKLKSVLKPEPEMEKKELRPISLKDKVVEEKIEPEDALLGADAKEVSREKKRTQDREKTISAIEHVVKESKPPRLNPETGEIEGDSMAQIVKDAVANYETALGQVDEEYKKRFEEMAEQSDKYLRSKDETRERNNWFRLASQLGQALTQYGAAAYGKKHGVNMAGLPVRQGDWDGVLKSNLDAVDDRMKELAKREDLLRQEKGAKLKRLKDITEMKVMASKEDTYRADKKAAAEASLQAKQQAKEIKRLEDRVEDADKKIKDSAAMEDRLRKEWAGSQVTKNTQTIASSFKKIHEVQADPSPAGDISLIFNYMKMLDPASVVREGEQATAAQARAVPDAILNMYNLLIEGQKLTPKQRADFVKKAGNTYQAQLEVQKTVDAPIRRVVAARGLEEAMVIDDSLHRLKELPKDKKEVQTQEDPKVKDYADKYFNGDYGQALEVLKKRGYTGG